MKKLLLSSLLSALTLSLFAGLNPVLQNPYTTNNQAAADAHVLSLITNTVATNIEVNFQMGHSYTNHLASVITIENIAVSFAMGTSNNFAVTYGVVGDFTNLMTYGVPIYVTPFSTAIWPFIPTFDVKTNQVYFFVDSSGGGVTAGFPYASQIHYLIPGSSGGGGGGGGGGGDAYLAHDQTFTGANTFSQQINGTATNANRATNADTATSAGYATAASQATNLAGGIVTNNQVINQSGTYTIPFGVSASINLTNGGNITVLGSGIITSNWLSMGAVENITCDAYCPNGGFTAFNRYTNQWQSVTCNIQSRLVDFNQGTIQGTLFHEYTTNQSDVFIINASERLNFWEIEVPLNGGGISGRSAAYLNTIPPFIQWTTPYFFTGYCGTNGLTATLNCINGSSISCGIWDVGDLNGNTQSGAAIFQMWTSRGGNAAYVTMNVGSIISTAPDSYAANCTGWTFFTYNTSSNSLQAIAGGLVLPTTPYCANTNVYGDVDFNVGGGAFIIGSYYDSFSQTFYTNLLAQITNAAPTVSPSSLLPSYYAGQNFSGQSSVIFVSPTHTLYTTNTSFSKPLVYTGNGSGLTNIPPAAITGGLWNGYPRYITNFSSLLLTNIAVCSNVVVQWQPPTNMFIRVSGAVGSMYSYAAQCRVWLTCADITGTNKVFPLWGEPAESVSMLNAITNFNVPSLPLWVRTNQPVTIAFVNSAGTNTVWYNWLLEQVSP